MRERERASFCCLFPYVLAMAGAKPDRRKLAENPGAHVIGRVPLGRIPFASAGLRWQEAGSRRQVLDSPRR